MKIHKLILLLLFQKVDNKIIKISEYITINVYIDDIDSNRNLAITRFITKIHLMNNLKANLLFEINVFESQKIILNFNYYLVRINICKNFVAFINVINRTNSYIKRIICVRKIFIIQSKTIINVSIIYYNKLSNNKDFLFKSQCFEYLEHNNEVFAYIVNASLFFI